MYKCRRTPLVRYERFYKFLASVLRHEERERETILNMLTILSDPTNALRIPWCLRSLSVEIWKTQLHLQWSRSNPQLSTLPQWQKLHSLPPWSNVSFQQTLFQKTSNSQDHLFRAWRYPHPSLISCLGFIMTIVIVISFAHERKTVPNEVPNSAKPN